MGVVALLLKPRKGESEKTSTPKRARDTSSLYKDYGNNDMPSNEGLKSLKENITMKIEENVIIAPYTTFKIGGPAKFFCSVATEDELVTAVKFAQGKDLPTLVIGGGSNLLVSDDGFKGLIIRCEINGKNFVDDSTDSVIVEANAGEDWENLVSEAVSRGLYGFESLSAIPGTVGASPVQNIGAYGVDVSSTIYSVRVLDTTDMSFKELTNGDCKFSYRDSIFKHEKGRYIVTRVTYKLSKNGKPNLSYRDVCEYFAAKKIADPTLQQVRDAVVEIRKSKLPDWKAWGTAGSFFKNPVVTVEKFEELKKSYPELSGYLEPDGRMKLSLGWILDKICNAKGLSVGNVSVYEKQALVLVAKPGATATEVVSLANELMRRVKDKTGIDIEGEVEWAVAD